MFHTFLIALTVLYIFVYILTLHYNFYVYLYFTILHSLHYNIVARIDENDKL